MDHPDPGAAEREWAADYIGRLWDLPFVALGPLERPIGEFWKRAPRGLRRRALRPFTAAQQAVWEVIRDPARLGTEAVARVPVWIREERVGFVLDFLLPEYGVNVQIDTWKPEYEEPEIPDLSFPIDPDSPWNDGRDVVLRECTGIESLHYWDRTVAERGAEEICAEIRKELGFGKPPWLHRDC